MSDQSHIGNQRDVAIDASDSDFVSLEDQPTDGNRGELIMEAPRGLIEYQELDMDRVRVDPKWALKIPLRWHCESR